MDATACHHPSAPRALVPLRREDARRGVDLGGTYEIQAVGLREGQIGRKLHLSASDNHSGGGGMCYFGIFGQIEKARIEAQVKAAEAAAQLKLEEEMRRKREQERKAARLALHMMKKTVDIDNSDFLKDLENLCQKWQLNPPSKLIVDFVHGIELTQGLGSPLEALGLFMKKDIEEEVEHEMEDSVSTSQNADVEEGEISCCQ
ncbi:transcription factor GTE9-like [Miscanthus floridulus]|uniref:transcription factor GTE9-like n=1 Tax=Miscanthus floridulus TaxID=154761 RepID=UPI00345A410E